MCEGTSTELPNHTYILDLTNSHTFPLDKAAPPPVVSRPAHGERFVRHTKGLGYTSPTFVTFKTAGESIDLMSIPIWWQKTISTRLSGWTSKDAAWFVRCLIKLSSTLSATLAGMHSIAFN
jgi:hypothetical protein